MIDKYHCLKSQLKRTQRSAKRAQRRQADNPISQRENTDKMEIKIRYACQDTEQHIETGDVK
jgi:hypothetical protein